LTLATRKTPTGRIAGSAGESQMGPRRCSLGLFSSPARSIGKPEVADTAAEGEEGR
jgi:hypothetical protein